MWLIISYRNNCLPEKKMSDGYCSFPFRIQNILKASKNCSPIRIHAPWRGRAVARTPRANRSFLFLTLWGEGGYFLIKEIQVCAAPKGMVLVPFGLKTGIDFALFGLESGMERSSITFSSIGKREFVPGDQVSPLLVVYCSLFLHIY